MAKPVVIKKYENRRLYDTSGSRYVNLPEIAEMLREGADVEVFDAKTGEDITSLILTQIIVDDTRSKKSVLPLDFLRGLIVASDRAMREFVGWYSQAAETAQRGAQHAFEASPFSSALPFIEKLIEVARPKDTSDARAAGARASAAGAETESVEALRARIAELERELRRKGPAPGGRKAGGRPRRKAASAPGGDDGTGEGR